MQDRQDDDLVVQPLPQRERRNFFIILLGLFVLTLPLLFLYATGYRFEFGNQDPFISTGGLYVAAERTGASIYIDDELVRETRTFRKAFYAQGLEPGIHKVHVQKPEHHTWVKELPVYPHLVTEAQAFNLPVVPQVRTISPWKNSLGETVVFDAISVVASSTNAIVRATTTTTTGLIADTEFATLVQSFATTSPITTTRAPLFIESGAETDDSATTTKTFNGVQLTEVDGDVYASFIGAREQMPYYYCAKDFSSEDDPVFDVQAEPAGEMPEPLIGPVQYIPDDAVCEPTIKIDRQGQIVSEFDFYPGSSDWVLMVLEEGIYVVEIDDRSWQNAQLLIKGKNLSLRVLNGNVYVYDGDSMYQVFMTT